MTNMVVTNVDNSSVGFGNVRYQPQTLSLVGAQVVDAGMILARDSVSGKLVLYVPGGAALKTTGDGTFNMTPGDAFVLDVDNVGNVTSTFTAAPATIEDTTTYTGGVAASITDTFTHGADQDGLTMTVTVTDALGGVVATVVTIAAACTSAAALAVELAAVVPGVLVTVPAGHVVLTTTAVGSDVSITVVAGTSAVTWDTPVAGTGGLTDQDGLTSIVTLAGGPWDGVAQPVTFAGLTTEVTQIAEQMNDQVLGASFDGSSGQVICTHDGNGTGMEIAITAGTGGLTWDTPIVGTGNVVDINAVTATEVKTIVELATDATVTVSGDAAIIKGLVELDFISGTALAKLGLTAETITANNNGVPVMVLPYELDGANGDNFVQAIKSGSVVDDKLVISDGSSLTDAIRDDLRNYSIIPEYGTELGVQDNQ